MKNCFLIINYNDSKSTLELLENIKDYKCLDKILIVDNKSTDDSYNILKKIKIKNLEVISTDCNKGYGAGINFGVRHLLKECDYKVIISNSDIIIKEEKDLELLLKDLDKKNIEVVGPRVNEHGDINRGWKIPSPFIDSLLNVFYIHRFIRKKKVFYDDEHYNNDISIVDAVSGCFFLLKASTLKEINYFDENIFLYYEENTLAKKIKNINKKTIIDNRVEIIHNHSVTIDKNINKLNKYKILKKSGYYFQKNYNNASLVNLFLYKITAFITQIVLTIYYFFKDIVSN